jgi:hypothetical protein
VAAKKTPAHRWLPGIARAWSVDVNNLGQSAHQVNGYAICAA